MKTVASLPLVDSMFAPHKPTPRWAAQCLWFGGCLLAGVTAQIAHNLWWAGG